MISLSLLSVLQFVVTSGGQWGSMSWQKESVHMSIKCRSQIMAIAGHTTWPNKPGPSLSFHHIHQKSKVIEAIVCDFIYQCSQVSWIFTCCKGPSSTCYNNSVTYILLDLLCLTDLQEKIMSII